jgi:hypothetical protein
VQLEVTEVGDKLAVVSLRHGMTRGAMATVCRALESLCLKVITASVTTVAGSIVHTMFVEVNIHDLLPFPVKLICPHRLSSFPEFANRNGLLPSVSVAHFHLNSLGDVSLMTSLEWRHTQVLDSGEFGRERKRGVRCFS